MQERSLGDLLAELCERVSPEAPDHLTIAPLKLQMFLEETRASKNPAFLVDLDAAPLVPEGFTIQSHKKGGSFIWNKSRVRLHREPRQVAGRMYGRDLQECFEGKETMNVCLRDWLLTHPDQIPEEWKELRIFFWETMFRTTDERYEKSLHVPFLYWNGTFWNSGSHYHEGLWSFQDPAVLRAS